MRIFSILLKKFSKNKINIQSGGIEMEKVKVQTKTSREDFMNQTGVIKEVEAVS